MTPDQVHHRLCDENVLRQKGGRRMTKVAAPLMGKNADGTIDGIDVDGNKISLPMRKGGKSLAARLNEEAEAKERAEKMARKR